MFFSKKKITERKLLSLLTDHSHTQDFPESNRNFKQCKSLKKNELQYTFKCSYQNNNSYYYLFKLFL